MILETQLPDLRNNESNKTISLVRRLLWFYVVVLCDWLKNLAPLSKPIKRNTKPNSWLALLCFSRACRPLLVSSQNQIDSFEVQRVLWLARRMTNFMTLNVRLLYRKKIVSCVCNRDVLQYMRDECLWGIPLLATISVRELLKNAVTLFNSPLLQKTFSKNAKDLMNAIQFAFFAVVIDGTTFSLTDFRLHGVSLDYGRLLN